MKGAGAFFLLIFLLCGAGVKALVVAFCFMGKAGWVEGRLVVWVSGGG